MVRRVPTKQRNASIKRERDQNLVIRLGLLLVCGLTLAVGFVYAAGQHFESLKLGYQTEDLRRVRDRLEAEHRRNILVREEAASPARLERAARQLGMQAMQPAQIDPLKRKVCRHQLNQRNHNRRSSRNKLPRTEIERIELATSQSDSSGGE